MTVSAEHWRPVPGFEDRYEVSDLGRVKSLGRTETFSRILNNGVRADVTRTKCEKILRAGMGSNGYLTVRLCGRTHPVHQLVLIAFIGPKPGGLAAACHGDGNRTNNRATNLRWDTYAANNAERFIHARQRQSQQRGGVLT